MPNTVVSSQGVSKCYQLGTINTGTFQGDLERWWVKLRGQPDPQHKIGERDHGNRENQLIWALRNISFTIQQGEVVGIIGRNGAGKSTLLKILSRITAPTSGTIKIKGKIASLLEVGTGFHPELTGRENIFLNGSILGMHRNEIVHKLDEIIDFSGVEKFIDTPVKRYSSGMYVRLAFAVAAHLEPEILIVDEVLAVGDAEFQKKCLGKMGHVAKEGRTVLFVSHNMAAIKNLCARAMLLDTGVITHDGNANDTISSYLGRYQTSSSIEIIPEARPRLGHGPARLRKIWLTNQCGELITNLYFAQSFRVNLIIELEERIRDEIMAFVYISAADGTRFGVTYNVENGSPGWQLDLGNYHVIIDIDAVLLPHHSYSFDVGLYNYPGTEVYDFVEQVLLFSVSSASEVGNDNYPGTQSHAFLRVSSKWHHPVGAESDL